MDLFIPLYAQLHFTTREIVLTNGFVKKTVKTPKSELDLARKYKADYERRIGHE